MELLPQDTHRSRLAHPSLPARRSHQGQCGLAEIVPLFSASHSQGNEDGGMVSRIARVFASLRAQAAPGGTPPDPRRRLPLFPVPCTT